MTLSEAISALQSQPLCAASHNPDRVLHEVLVAGVVSVFLERLPPEDCRPFRDVGGSHPPVPRSVQCFHLLANLTSLFT